MEHAPGPRGSPHVPHGPGPIAPPYGRWSSRRTSTRHAPDSCRGNPGTRASSCPLHNHLEARPAFPAVVFVDGHDASIARRDAHGRTGALQSLRDLVYWRDAFLLEDPAGRRQPAAPQRRHRRARRSRQDHAGRRDAAPERHLPRQRAGRRPGDGQQRARARARHHDPCEEHRRSLPGPADQHRRYARPRRLRRGSRAHAGNGRRHRPAGGCVRGPAAADPLRAAQGAGARPVAGRRHQQDRSARRAQPRRCSTRSTTCSSISTPPRSRSSSRCCTPALAPERRRAISTRQAPTCGRCSTRLSTTCRRRAGTSRRHCSCW